MLTEENSHRQLLAVFQRHRRETGRWPWWVEYPLVITTTAATVLLHKALGLGEPAPIVFLFPIIICAYIGGLRPGLISTGLAAVTANFFLIPPVGSFSIDQPVDIARLVALIVAGAIISVLTESLHRWRVVSQLEKERRSLLPTERKVQAGFAAGLLFLIVMGVVSYLSVVRLRENVTWVKRTEEVIAQIRSVVSAVSDVQNAHRGYTITGEERYLAPYQIAAQQLDAQLQKLREMTADDPEQQRRFDAFTTLVHDRMNISHEIIELRRTKGFAAAQRVILSGKSQEIQDRIYRLAAEMEEHELALLEKREASAARAASLTKGVIIGGSALAFVFVAVALFVIGQDFAGSRRAQAALREAHDLLESRVRERTTQLAQINQSLTALAEISDKVHRSLDFQTVLDLAIDSLMHYSQAPLVAFYKLDERSNHLQLLSSKGFSPQILETAQMIPLNGSLTGLAIVSRDVVISENIAADGRVEPQINSLLQAEGFQSIICVPLIFQERVLGAMDIFLKQAHKFKPHERKTLFSIGTTIGLAMANAEYTEILQKEIQDRKRVEETLRQSKESFRLLVEEVQDYAIIRLDSEGRVRSWNSGAQKIKGYCAEEIIGQHISCFYTPEDLERGRPEMLLRNALEHGRCEDEGWRMRKDGSRFWAQVVITALRNEQGGLTGFSKITRDTTENHAVAEALRESEERLQTVMENLTEGLVVSKLDGQLLHWNRAAVEMHGFNNLEECLRMLPEFMNIFELSTLENKVLSYEQWPLPRIIRGENLRNYDLRIRKIGADWQRIFSYGGSIIRDASGNELAFVTITDITKRKNAEAALRHAYDDLEKKVAERTLELKQTADALRDKNTELREFAYTVSHDLKAPLRGISGYAQELDRRHRQGLSERASFCVNQIISAVAKLDQLIEDLLHYSRLERETIVLSQVNVKKMVENLLAEHSKFIAEKGVQIAADLRFTTLAGWERGIRQVLANLLDNALKYSSQAQPPRITITGEELENGYRLSVADNGIGFNMKYHDRIFGLFNRLVRPDQFEGTGAGLAIVKKLVEKQKGRIWAQSSPGEGSTFFVELPKLPVTQH